MKTCGSVFLTWGAQTPFFAFPLVLHDQIPIGPSDCPSSMRRCSAQPKAGFRHIHGCLRIYRLYILFHQSCLSAMMLFPRRRVQAKLARYL
jgi:hypothetical protein